MPNIKSAAKRLRSDKKKNEQNQRILSELNTLNKKLTKTTAETADIEKTGKLLIKKYDQAVSKGAVPKGRADRKKSRIAKLIAKAVKSKGKKA